MEGIYSDFIKPNKLLEEFLEKDNKFERRYSSLLTDINTFIETNDLSQHITVNKMELGYALISYFEDIMRLKEFHHVGHVNNIKIVAYTSYWLLRMKPLQSDGTDKKYMYINERFVLSYILSFLEDENCGNILERSNPGLRAFAESFLYYLKYRPLNPQVIEMNLISFFAGQIYQSVDEDISDKMGKFSTQ